MKNLFILFFLFISLKSFSQTFIDATAWGSSDAEQIDKIVTDKDGNTISVGYFDSGTLTIGQTVLTSKGNREGLIIKSDKTGKVLWAKSIGGPNLDWIYNATTDASGNIYICGKYGDFAQFDSKSTLGVSVTSDLDGFVAKYDKDGNFIWVKTINGTSQEIINGIAIDATGNVYLAGYTGGIADMDPGTSTVNITSLKYADGFLIKLDETGKYLWHNQLGSNTSADEATNVLIDKTGNVIVLGYFSGTMDIDPSTTTTNLVALSTDDNSYLCKYKSDGKLIYGKLIGSTASCNIREAAIDIDDNITICGRFSGTCSFDGIKSVTSSGGVDGFVATFDVTGKTLKSFKIGGSEFDLVTSVFVDNVGNYFITGNIQSQNVNFDLAGGTKTLSTSAFSDIFMAKYDKSLKLLHSSVMGGTGYDGGSSITVSQGRISIGARFQNTVDFDPSAKKLELTSNGSYDIAIITFSENNVAVKNIEDVKVNIFPNPTRDIVFFDTDFNKAKKFTVINSIGQNCYKIEKFKDNSLDFSNLPIGAYTILIEWNDGLLSRSRIVKL